MRYGFSPRYVGWLLENATKYDAVIVHGLWNFATMAAALVLPSIMWGKYYVYPHGMLDPWFAKHDPRKYFLKRISWLGLEGRLLAGAKAVLFTAPDEQILAQGQFWGWTYNGVVVGYGTAEPPAASPEQIRSFREAVPTLGDRKFLLFLSRIHPKKGCDLLVRAFAAVAATHEDLDLVIAGPDETGLVPQLEALAESLGVRGRIHWPGMLSGDEKWGAYREAEVFVLPSHQENFGIVIAEALACSLPVLTTNKVNIWREVEAGGAGLVRNDDVGGAIDLLETWLRMSGDERKIISRSARRVFDEHFSVEYVSQRFLQLLVDDGVCGASDVNQSVALREAKIPHYDVGEDAA